MIGNITRVWSITLLIVISPVLLSAHGVTRTVKEGKAMILTALYDTGEPISYALVKIYSPGKLNIEYQNGRTDAQGSFAFQPSSAGDWLVRLDDGMGHGFEEHVRVDSSMHGVNYTPLLIKLGQKVIILLLLAWGSIMTWLFFRKTRSKI